MAAWAASASAASAGFPAGAASKATYCHASERSICRSTLPGASAASACRSASPFFAMASASSALPSFRRSPPPMRYAVAREARSASDAPGPATAGSRRAMALS